MARAKNFMYFKENELPEPVPLPSEYRELVLKQPFGQGNYTLKYNIIRQSKETTLIEAYTRLVRVGCSDGIHWENITVEPYERRIETRLINKPPHNIAS